MKMKLIAVPLFVCAAAYGTQVYYTASGTVTSSAGSSGFISIGVTFNTLQNAVQVTIQNFVLGGSKDVQGISAIDFVLSSGQTASSITSESGLVRTINADGTWTPGTPVQFSDPSYVGQWIVQPGAALINGVAGSIDLTALSGGSPSMTIFGAPDGTSPNCCYGKPNKAVTSHNPYLATDGQPVVFLLSVPGVTSATTIQTGPSRVRFFFGTDRTAFLDGAITSTVPEPSNIWLGGFGILSVLAWARIARRKSESCLDPLRTSPTRINSPANQ